MMKPELTQEGLIATASKFCRQTHCYADLFGVTDGKAVGTFVEHKFRDVLEANFSVMAGNSAKGLDLPSAETDIKVTSRRQPQSSCPFRSARQKVYGLGYNLLLMVYEKNDDHEARLSTLEFVCCAFIEKPRTADYQLTRQIRETLERDGNRDDILALLLDRNLPGDEITLGQLAEEILQLPPEQGYLTISNAMQWRLQYERVVKLSSAVSGIARII
jgi:hypothetical protein